MLGEVERSASDVNRGPEPCQSGSYSTHLSSFMPLPAYTVLLQARVVSDCVHHGAVRAYAHDDHYLTRSKFN